MEIVTLINPTGRVVRVSSEEADKLLGSGKGFQKILNPKESYYPQYDQSIPSSVRFQAAEAASVKKEQVESEFLEGAELV